MNEASTNFFCKLEVTCLKFGKLNDTYLGKLKFDGNSLLLAMEY